MNLLINKANFLGLVLFTLLIGSLGNAQSFVKTVGKATDVTISPKDGSVFVINASGNVKKYNSKTKRYTPYGKQSSNAKAIAVDPSGNIYMVSKSNDIFIDVNGRWNPVPGTKAREIEINNKGDVRVLSMAGKIYSLKSGKFQPHRLANQNTTGFNQFVITPRGKDMYARSKNNDFKVFKGGKWQALNGKPLRISIDAANGDVYAVGRNKGIYKWNDSRKKWDLLDNTRKDLKEVAVYNGKIWATGTNNNIYWYNPTRSTSSSSSRSNTIKPGDYAGTYRVTFTNIYATGEEKIYGTIGVYLEAVTKSGKTFIRPLDGKPNRVLDISKTEPRKKSEKNTVIKTENIVNRQMSDDWNTSKYLSIDKVREFNLQGEAANAQATFDFQLNYSEERLGKDWGKYMRFKINVKDIRLGEEIFIHNFSNLSFLGVIISKN